MKYACGHCGELFDSLWNCKDHQLTEHREAHVWEYRNDDCFDYDEMGEAIARKCAVCGADEGIESGCFSDRIDDSLRDAAGVIFDEQAAQASLRKWWFYLEGHPK